MTVLSAGNGTNDSPGMPAVSTRDGRQTNDSAESAGNGTDDSPCMPAVWNDPQGNHNDGSQTSEVAECIICCSSIVESECQVAPLDMLLKPLVYEVSN
jgi:hypothetical protein